MSLLIRPTSKVPLDPSRAYAAVHEEERGPDGTLLGTAVVFLTNRECPFRCVMCDLWVHTLDRSVGRGAIPLQIARALEGLPPVRQIKLYNAGSFFDPAAIPPEDDAEIAALLRGYERVIVESHPAFLRGVHGERCLRLRDALGGALEVAIGLETADAGVLARLNKGMTLESFASASRFLSANGLALRAFVLLKPPFTREEDAVTSACRSLDFAFGCGAAVTSVIPTRGGNPEMEREGEPFVPPTLDALERVLEYGIACGRGRVFADLWEVERFYTCACSPARAERLRLMNREQRQARRVACVCTGAFHPRH